MIKKVLHFAKHSGPLISFFAFWVSVGLLVASMIIPPPGIVDPSVLMAIGEIGIFSTLCRIPDFIEAVRDGKKLEYHKGDTSVTVTSEKEDDEHEVLHP